MLLASDLISQILISTLFDYNANCFKVGLLESKTGFNESMCFWNNIYTVFLECTESDQDNADRLFRTLTTRVF